MDHSSVEELQMVFLRASRQMASWDVSPLLNGISHQEYLVLEQIYLHDRYGDTGGLRNTDLATLMQVTLPAVSRTIRSMEDAGLLIREPDPQDRRNVFLHLTEKGEGIRSFAEGRMLELLERIGAKVGEEKAQRFFDTLQEMMVIMDQEIRSIKKQEKGE